MSRDLARGYPLKGKAVPNLSALASVKPRPFIVRRVIDKLILIAIYVDKLKGSTITWMSMTQTSSCPEGRGLLCTLERGSWATSPFKGFSSGPGLRPVTPIPSRGLGVMDFIIAPEA